MVNLSQTGSVYDDVRLGEIDNWFSQQRELTTDQTGQYMTIMRAYCSVELAPSSLAVCVTIASSYWT